MPLALYALTVGSFGIGVTEFVIMGLLLDVGADFHVSTSMTGLLISGYALGVVIGAPGLTVAMARWPRKYVLMALMAIFVAGNVACAVAPNYTLLMAARVLTAFAHGTYFGVGSVVATRLVPPDKRASAIAVMFTGLTVANILGVPFGTWLGQHYGWRSTFWAVSVVGVLALAVIAAVLPNEGQPAVPDDWRADIKALARRPVILGLITTVLGYGGLFTAFTYIAPLLTKIGGFAESSISPILLLFGGGLVVGNLLSGRFADRSLKGTVFGTLALLCLVLLGLRPALDLHWTSLVAVALLGAAGFATVAPLQIWVLSKTHGAGESLVSSFNIAAFNLGNALGAWAGGLVIDHGLGLAWVAPVAALFPIAAIALVVLSMALDRRTSSIQPREAVLERV